MFGFNAAVAAVPVIFKPNYIIQFRSGDLYKSDVILGFNAMHHAGHDVDNIASPKIDFFQTSNASLATIEKYTAPTQNEVRLFLVFMILEAGFATGLNMNEFETERSPFSYEPALFTPSLGDLLGDGHVLNIEAA
ncbi:hypothetical protein GA0061099_10172 [Bradyrhizobium yuanmingense]|uniref:Uncharacterized protein n=1 Tax=Bradyrhizobium yuanmingense TaxID=108015 RepID=A0A1C3XGE9_9BRAD|nr:hypothetical protein IQ15_07110 [Bradyrhizobium yuanmingense]SCB51289.1 hypothetical protein GA0061099_10172 [Bradyrhizobium yuanmingense]